MVEKDSLRERGFMTAKEVAELFGVTQNTVRQRWSENGYLLPAFVMPSGRLYYDEAEVSELYDSCFK